MGLDIKKRLYVVKEMPDNLGPIIMYKNVYTFFGKDIPAYLEDHYVDDKLDMSYLVFRGERAILPANTRMAIVREDEQVDTLEEIITRVDTGEALIFFNTINDVTYISKINVYEPSVKDFSLPKGIITSPIERPRDIHYSVYRGDIV